MTREKKEKKEKKKKKKRRNYFVTKDIVKINVNDLQMISQEVNEFLETTVQ